LLGLATSALLASCTTKEPQESTYFERTIAPVLTTSCVRTNTGAGCHVADAKGNAFGNLDVSSFDGVSHRRDLLLDYGPYGQPALLVKNVPPFQVAVQLYDGSPPVVVTTDIKHTGGPILDPTASAYQTLRRWIENGATENNGGAPPPALQRLPCTDTIPAGVAGFDPNNDPPGADYTQFKSDVAPVIQGTCAASNCHGTSSNDLYLTCGNGDQELRWNYFAATQYLASKPEQSEIVRRPLAPSQGGSFHEGGIIFPTSSDSGYRALLAWAQAHGPLNATSPGPAFDFFVHAVQPMLVKKGCMMLQCHSAAMFHDYRLRGGSGGSFSFSASQRNYALSLAQLALESDDVNASRIVQKNLFRPELSPGAHGIAHRGGPLLEDFPGASANGAACDAGSYNYDDPKALDGIPAYCVIREWHRRERVARSLGAMSAIVYVKRPLASGPDRAQDFDTYQPGAELHLVDATLDPTAPGGVKLGANDRVLNAACGLDAAGSDIRRPSVSWDGKTIAFAARTSGSAPLAVYTVGADGTGCAPHAEINAGPTSGNGLLVHNFDPAFSPPGPDRAERIVFASTRGNLATDPYDYSGPQRTPADPSKPNANLYVWEPDPNAPGKNRIRQGTFLLDMERMPSFMSDGRLIFATEKRAQDFYQIALRRMNLDGGDYHPLYAQRATIGFHEARYPVELENKSFAAILSDKDAPHGAGTLAVFNRSIGVDFTSADPTDYVVDSSVVDPLAPASPEPQFFLHSLTIVDPRATGHAGATNGLYTSPAPLPNANVLVSWGAAGDFASFGGDYDLYVVDPSSGVRTKLLGAAGSAEVEAVAVYERADRGIFQSTLDEPNGHTIVYEGKTEADVTVLDVPVLASLVFQNTPTGRLLEPLSSVDIYEDLPPTPDVTSLTAGAANVYQDAFGLGYTRRRKLGTMPVASDGSAHVAIPGGLPIVLHLPDTDASRKANLPRFQREEMEFAPGEYVHQSFPRTFFSGFCGNCHGAISGRPLDVSVQPDMLTQASSTAARGTQPVNLLVPPSQRGAVEGP
jgi:hypothetical protein